MLITFEKILFLKTIPLFENIPESVLCDIVEQSNEISAPALSDIIGEDELFDSLYIVMQGSVIVSKDGKPLKTFGKGSVFGEVYAFSPCQSQVAISAKEDTSLLQIDNDTIYSLINDYSDVAKTFIPLICQRLRKFEDICL